MAAQEKGKAGFGSSLTLAEKEVLDSAVDIIRVRTLSLLRRLADDGERKSSAIRFLVETDILSKLNIHLNRADLSRTNLRGINFKEVELVGSDLSYADLSYADLSHTNMRGAVLRGSKLMYAKLEGCDLLGADLQEADLSNASYDKNTNIGNKELLATLHSIGNIEKKIIAHSLTPEK